MTNNFLKLVHQDSDLFFVMLLHRMFFIFEFEDIILQDEKGVL